LELKGEGKHLTVIRSWPLGSGASDVRRRADGASDEAILVAAGAGAEAAAALGAVPLVAAVAAAAEHVLLAAAPAAGGEGGGAGAGHDAAELAGLVEAPDLVGAAEVAAPDEYLGQRGAPRGREAREERRELGEVARVHGEVPLVDGDAEPAQDGAHGPAVLVRAANHVERGEVEHDAAFGGLGGGGAGGRRRLEGAERAEGRGGDADPVEDADAGGGGAGRGGRRGGRGCVRQQQRLEVLEGGRGEGQARGGGGGGGYERGGCGRGGGGGRRARLHPGQPHEGRWAWASGGRRWGRGRRRGFVRFLDWGLTGGTRARRPGCCFVGVTLECFVLMLCFALGASDIIVSGLVAFFLKKNPFNCKGT
jgi:hypothetical protein